MRAEIRRIDLTTSPATVEPWPSLDWLAPPEPFDPAVPGHVAPRGRSGLWDAMANAVQRAREASLAESDADARYGGTDSDLLVMSGDAPHLAYLARVAGRSTEGAAAERSAEVIDLDDVRRRDRD